MDNFFNRRLHTYMAEIKSLGASADKWQERAASAVGEYVDGAKGSGGKWEANALAAEDSYKQGVIEAANAGRYGRGVDAAGAGKYESGIREKGSQRYAAGVQVAKDDWARGFSPYRDVIEGLDLPPRGPKGSPQNLQRVAVIAQALHERRVG